MLFDSDALMAPYIVAALVAVFAAVKNRDVTVSRQTWGYRIIVIISLVFAAFITLANHDLFMHPVMPDIRSPLFVRLCKAGIILVLMAGSFSSVINILIYTVYDKQSFKIAGRSEDVRRAYLYFIIPFAVISVLCLCVFNSCYYPGLLSIDSIDQVSQVFTGEYSNHQPFYHTMIIQLFIRLGQSLFNDINAGIAMYSTVQILFMSFTFSFVIYTMAKLRLPLWTEVIAFIWYALMPFNIMYSFTVWKDVYFGAFMTLLVVFFIRTVNGIGNRYVNLVGFALCGPVICLIRSNGLFAYVFAFLAALLLLKKDRVFLIIMPATVVLAFVLKHSVLSAVKVTQPDTVESLNIPLQQVARVFADGGNVAPEDMDMLAQIMDVDAIADAYDPVISDPIKALIRDYGNMDFLAENKGEYALVYLRIFARNPLTYVIAWVDSTRGFWNSGYNYWVWYWDVESNPYGIVRTIRSDNMLRFMDEYLWLFYNNRILQLFTAIGLFTWIFLTTLIRNCYSGSKCGIIAMAPVTGVLISLLISSPVFSEFRYVYSMFCLLPFIVFVTFARKTEGDGSRSEVAS